MGFVFGFVIFLVIFFGSLYGFLEKCVSGDHTGLLVIYLMIFLICLSILIGVVFYIKYDDKLKKKKDVSITFRNGYPRVSLSDRYDKKIVICENFQILLSIFLFIAVFIFFILAGLLGKVYLIILSFVSLTAFLGSVFGFGFAIKKLKKQKEMLKIEKAKIKENQKNAEEKQRIKKRELDNKERKQNLEKARLAKVNKKIEREMEIISKIEKFIDRYVFNLNNGEIKNFISSFNNILDVNLLSIFGKDLFLFVPYFKENFKIVPLFDEKTIEILKRYNKKRELEFFENNRLLKITYENYLKGKGFSWVQEDKENDYKNTYATINLKTIWNNFNKFFNALVNKGILKNTSIDKESLLLLIGELYYKKESDKELQIYERYKNIFIEDKNIETIIREFLINEKDKSLILSILNGKNIAENNFTLDSYYSNFRLVDSVKEKIKKEKESEEYLKNLLNPKTIKQKEIRIVDIDVMSGKEFEKYISEMFSKMGYYTKLTKDTNDQGIDVIAEKNKLKIAIQAKCYSNKVGNHAIMEAVAGMKYYKADKCMVITNNYFTPSAKELAKANNVELWDREVLIEKLEEI